MVEDRGSSGRGTSSSRRSSACLCHAPRQGLGDGALQACARRPRNLLSPLCEQGRPCQKLAERLLDELNSDIYLRIERIIEGADSREIMKLIIRSIDEVGLTSSCCKTSRYAARTCARGYGTSPRGPFACFPPPASSARIPRPRPGPSRRSSSTTPSMPPRGRRANPGTLSWQSMRSRISTLLDPHQSQRAARGPAPGFGRPAAKAQPHPHPNDEKGRNRSRTKG